MKVKRDHVSERRIQLVRLDICDPQREEISGSIPLPCSGIFDNSQNIAGKMYFKFLELPDIFSSKNYPVYVTFDSLFSCKHISSSFCSTTLSEQGHQHLAFSLQNLIFCLQNTKSSPKLAFVFLVESIYSNSLFMV